MNDWMELKPKEKHILFLVWWMAPVSTYGLTGPAKHADPEVFEYAMITTLLAVSALHRLGMINLINKMETNAMDQIWQITDRGRTYL